MKAVLALVMIYVAMFFLAIQGASPNSVQAERQNGASQAARSIDPVKEADIRSLMELVGARDAMQDFTDHGADQLRENLFASVPKSDHGQQFVNAFVADYKAKFNADDATARLVAIYDQHFTQDEIKGLLQFYGSPLGQKFAAEKINGEMQSANRAYSMRIAKDVVKDLRKQYPGMAAHVRFTKPHHAPAQIEQAQQQAQTQP